ncbi:Ni/Fe hydrogenase subunit alpha [bacterium]|nr:Ni/Fe hydrogenase subunit alpha [bacterium]
MHDHPDGTLTVEHVARVEGHGNIVINVRDGRVEDVRLEIVESPRFFESMLVGQDAVVAPELTSRICGICSVGHTTASIKAVEAAFGMEPSVQTLLLRRVILDAEIIQSHILHVYFLVAPDVFRSPSVFPLAGSHPDIVKRALRLKKFANRIMAVIGGRHIHPVALKVGGFSAVPSDADLRDLAREAEDVKRDIDETVELFRTIRFPEFHRNTEYLALKRHNQYAFYDGDITSNLDGGTNPDQYLQRIKESVVAYSTAKHARSNGRVFAVGALARYALNGRETLSDRAARAAAALELERMKDNPFANNLAQVVECVHLCDDVFQTIDTILARGVRQERPVPAPERAGRGVGSVEVPRGTLYHEYEIDKHGHILRANCIIPTGQNLARMEQDLREMVPGILDLPRDEIRLRCEMLVRAYDPCISCSTHMLDVSFIDINEIKTTSSPLEGEAGWGVTPLPASPSGGEDKTAATSS